MKLKTKFQDNNFELGEVANAGVSFHYHENKVVVHADKKGSVATVYEYDSIKDFTDHWEDASEEPKEHWAIDQFGEPINVSGLSRLQLEKLHRLGNDFPNKNATMKAIEKLKAWKRLEENGFRFIEWELDMKTIADGKIWFDVGVNTQWDAEHLLECEPEVKKSLDLLFGGGDD